MLACGLVTPLQSHITEARNLISTSSSNLTGLHRHDCLGCPGHADLPKPVSTSAKPYSITLSLGENWNITSTGLPKATVTFVNLGSHTLAIFLTSTLSNFTVEYKVTKDSATSSTAWQTLRPNHQLSFNIASPGKSTDTATRNILLNLVPKQEYKYVYALDDFPMSKVGLYRITAFTKIPNVSELDGPASLSTVVRTFTLDLRSNSIIVRRTATGFAEVPAVANKPAPAH